MSRLPIFHDDFSFHDRQSNIFDDMRRQMGSSSFGNRSMGHPFDNDPFNRMGGDFYTLRPRDPISRVKRSDDIGGSRESLDGESAKSLFIEDPETKSRRFQVSFDVKDYNPQEVSLKMQDDTLLVEAKNEKLQEGNKLISEFSRKVKIPKEVDPDKISSMLSTDGVLTISAPVPPNYQSITDGRASPAYSPNKAPSLQSHQGRNSPSMNSPPVHSPIKSYGRNSPLASPKITTKSFGRNSPSMSSPPIVITNSAPQPTYKKQIYMVPTPVANTTINSHQHHQNQNGGTPVKVQSTARPKTPPLDTPTFYNTERGCEMVLMMNIGLPYTPEDLLVKVDGRNLIVEAEHVEVMNGKKSKSSISREFELHELVDPQTVTALLKDGRLKITGLAK